MKIATTNEAFIDFTSTRTDKSLLETLPLLAETDFRNIDICFYGILYQGTPLATENWREWAHSIADTAAKLNLKLVQAHASDGEFAEGESYDYAIEMIRREFECCKIMGIPNMVVHPLYTWKGNWRESLEASRKFYTALLPTLEKTGVNLLVENIYSAPENRQFLFRNAEGILTTLQAVGNHPLMHALWDVGHAHMDELDQYREIMTLGSELRGLHIHDNCGQSDDHLAPFEGTCCYDAILRGLIDSGYTGYFTLETLYRAPWRSDPRFTGEYRLTTYPLPLKLRYEHLKYDTAKYILEQYGCFED